MITPTNLNDLAQQIHANAKAKGFWDEPRNTGEVFMLIVSELGEALEAHRSGKRVGESIDFGVWGIMVYGHFKQSFEREVKGTFEGEIADVVIRILDYCAFAEIEIDIPMYEMHGDFEVGKSDNIGGTLLGITTWICKAADEDCSIGRAACLNAALIICCNLADAQGFDLIQHIELKMKYNATREHRQGKKY